MRRIAMVAGVLLLAGCGGGMAPHGGGPAPVYGDLLSARLFEGAGGRLEVGLSEPAYVAVFEVVPGRGAGLFYPAYSSERPAFHAGWTPLRVGGTRFIDSYSEPIRFDRRQRGAPRYFLLVASRNPLHIAPLQNSAGGMRRLLGHQGFSSPNAHRVMRDVVDAILPAQPDEDWDTDVLVLWPEARSELLSANYVAVACRDGSIRRVPREFVPYACVMGHPPVADSPPPRDTLVVETPTRRRPEPARPGGDGDRPVRPADAGPEVPGRTRPGGETLRPEAVEGVPEPAPARPRAPAARPQEPVDRPRVTPPPAESEPRLRPEPAGEPAPRAEPAPPAPAATPEPAAPAPAARPEPAAPSAPAPEPAARPEAPASAATPPADPAPRAAPASRRRGRAPSEPRARPSEPAPRTDTSPNE